MQKINQEFLVYPVRFDDGSEKKVSDRDIILSEGASTLSPAQKISEPQSPSPKRRRVSKEDIQKAKEIGIPLSEYIDLKAEEQQVRAQNASTTTASTVVSKNKDPARKPNTQCESIWSKIKSYKWYALGAVALVIPFLFGMHSKLTSLPFFQISKRRRNTRDAPATAAAAAARKNQPKNKTGSSALSGLTKPQLCGIAAVTGIVGYSAKSMLCSGMSTGIAVDESRCVYISSAEGRNFKDIWQRHGCTIGLLIIFLIGLGLVLSLRSGHDSRYDDYHRDDLEWGSHR